MQSIIQIQNKDWNKNYLGQTHSRKNNDFKNGIHTLNQNIYLQKFKERLYKITKYEN